MTVERSWPSTVPRQLRVWLVVLAAGLVLLPLALFAPFRLLLAGCIAVALVWGVYAHPPLAAYTLLVVTPLTAGIERGTFVPLLRLHEAVALLVGAGLVARAASRLVAGRLPRPRLRRLDAAILLMAFTSSVLPVLWVLARGRDLTTDDVLYAATLWKFYGVYLIVRASVSTRQEVGRCLWLIMGVGAVVAIIAVLQSLDLFGVPGLLEHWFVPDPDVTGGEGDRGTATLDSSIAVADVMVFNLAIALGWLLRGGKHRTLLLALAGIFTFGVFTAGQFSGAIGLFVGVAAVGLITGHLRRVTLGLIPAVLAAMLVLRPVVSRRLSGFDSPSGLPFSWVGRLENLRTYFWPELFSNFNFLLGVQPAARVLAPGSHQAEHHSQWVWIESGHTWLLWTGGVPFFLSFFIFLWVAIRKTVQTAQERMDAVGVAAVASFTSLVVLGFLMVFDVHLILRGSADLLFSLLALTSAPDRPSWREGRRR
jgi:hypothetical protein